VDRLCAAPSDARTFRAEVMDTLRRSIPIKWFAWVLTDPRTAVGVDPLAQVPDLGALPRLIRLRYTTRANRWTSLADVASLGSPSPTDPWTTSLREYGVTDVASMVMRDPYGCWAFLDLWSGAEFSRDDLALLRDLAPRLTTALRTRRAATFTEVSAERPVSGPAVLLLEDDLHITGHTPASDEWAELLLPRPEGDAAIPAAAYNVAAQLLAQEQEVDDSEPLGRTHVADGQWVTLRASRVSPEGQIAVSIEPSSAHDRLDVFARAAALSPRETELVRLLSRGASTSDIAGLLHLSAYTVQDHCTAVFEKTGVRSRRELVSRVLGVRTPP
jgi:DNA-binding CsgD family transcriptional regulator